MADRNEWGPWIEHDGNSCPCFGYYVQVEGICAITNKTLKAEGVVRNVSGWLWANVGRLMPDGKFQGKLLRYRIRRPRGMEVLDDILADIPAKQGERV